MRWRNDYLQRRWSSLPWHLLELLIDSNLQKYELFLYLLFFNGNSILELFLYIFNSDFFEIFEPFLHFSFGLVNCHLYLLLQLSLHGPFDLLDHKFLDAIDMLVWGQILQWFLSLHFIYD